ncbi:hypothetical protein J3R82DRAFT_8929 [Butyriboletus roseoflavus]|nr:hypothetical protein J3R82DRAFT_8929 [Butyriboletus roseoflavus]
MSYATSSSNADSPFYSMLFLDKFDISSPGRHLLQGRLNYQNMEQEVKRRHIALQIIRRRDTWNPNLAEAFATIYVMLLEDDGRNWEQVLLAGLPTFIPIFMRERLLESASDNHGWPLENELNTLAVALFWLISSRDRLDQETNEFRKEIMTYLAPFAFAGFRYPCFTSPEDLLNPRNRPADQPTEIMLDYFGEPITLCLPPIAPFAILSYFVRMEYFRLKVPPELPLSRQDAADKGILWGPTRDDIDDFNARCVTRVAGGSYGDPFDGLLKSRRHDPDWRRSLSSSDAASTQYYIPGTFSGRWQGSFIAPYQEDYRSMFYSAEAPSPFPTFGRFPLYVQFRELYCYSPSTPLPVAEDEISFFNAFLPLGSQWHEDESGIEFVGPNNSFRTHYTPLWRSRDVSDVPNMRALDVIITGITEAPYATAWNGYKYIGRIRLSDGLVVLLREPLDPQRVDLGRALFRGYVISSRNFVGRWRHISSAEQPAEWESIFSLCKEERRSQEVACIKGPVAVFHVTITDRYRQIIGEWNKPGSKSISHIIHFLVTGMPTSASLESVPQEVLEHIALLAATWQGPVGPPSGLPPLLLTCRPIYRALSCEANPYIYARVFSYQFDTGAVFRRLGSRVNARVLANELKKRWSHLKRIRARTSSRIRHAESHQLSPTLIDLLWLSYLMMLENDGKNELQLLDYAEMDAWLMEYWFDDEGASSAAHMILEHAWPIEDEKNSIAMWLFWFLLRPNLIKRNMNMTRFSHMRTIMNLTALAANHYPICRPSWTDFLPRSEAISPPSVITHFSEAYRLNPPTLAPAAILTFHTLTLQILIPAQANHMAGLSLQSPASLSLTMRRSEDWDTDWHRCINLSQSDRCRGFSEAYVLGSTEGVWEGLFTYTEFSIYSSLLSGGAPPAINQVAHHRQTWKLREYYLAEHRELAREESRPLRSGDPLKAHFPTGTQILQELSDSVEIQEPGTDAVRYWRPSHPISDSHKVVDIIILGEGHSSWGQFNLYGRPNLNIAKLKRKMDTSSLTLQIAGETVSEKGRFYMLWRNGDFIVIQAEPWWRPGFVPNITLPMSHYLEEHRALWHLQEVIQTMLDTIVFDGENNWAHLVRLKDNSYRLVYKKRRLIHNCPIWTKRRTVDIFIGWQDDWGVYVSAESRGQKLIQSMSLGRYFFDLKAHVSKNGIVVGIMLEAHVGRMYPCCHTYFIKGLSNTGCVTPADRFAVFEAVADIQRHGIFFSVQICDIYITEQGVRFASASTAKYYRDRDALAEEAKFTWKILGDMFDHMDDEPFGVWLSGSRSMGSNAFIIPRLPSPGRPITMTPEEAIIRWVWSVTTSDEFCRFQGCAFVKLQMLYRSPEHSATRRDKRIKGDSRALLPPDDISGNLGTSVARTQSVDEPLIVNRGPLARWHPYARPTSKRLRLPQASDIAAPTT